MTKAVDLGRKATKQTKTTFWGQNCFGRIRVNHPTVFQEYSYAGFNSLPPGKYFMLFCRLLIFFQNQLFEKFFQE